MKKAIFLLVSGMLILSLAGSAMANPADMAVNPGTVSIIPDGTTVRDVSILIQLINYVPYGDHERIATISTTSPDIYVQADMGDGTVSDWANTASKTLVYNTSVYKNSAGDVPYTLHVKGTGVAGVQYQVKIDDRFLYTYMGTDPNEITDETSVTIYTTVPEFPTVALPVAAILGLAFIFGRRKEGL